MVGIYFKGQDVPEWANKVTLYKIDPEKHVKGLLTFGSPCLVFKWCGCVIMYAPFTGRKVKYISDGYAMKLAPFTNSAIICGGGKGISVYFKFRDVKDEVMRLWRNK